MKRILLVVPSLGIGGQEKIAINTLESLKPYYDVNLVVFQRKDVEYNCPCEVIDINVPTKVGFFSKVVNQIRRIAKLAYIRKKLKSDIVISFGSTANITNVLSAPLSRGKTVSAIHGFAELKSKSALRLILQHSDKVICIAQAMQAEVLKKFPKSKNCVVVENGYEVCKILEKSKEEICDIGSEPYIVAMGRLEDVKGFDRLIRSFSRVVKEYPMLRLVILGQGRLEEKLKELTRALGIGDNVLFVGYRKNPYPYLRQAQLFVLSSLNEGFPNSLIETLACGTPIVSVDCPSGPREILSEVHSDESVVGIKEEKYGILIENSKSSEVIEKLLFEAMIKLLGDEKKKAQYSARGFERAKCFDSTVYAKKIIDVIESV